jgi:hypothetical protein
MNASVFDIGRADRYGVREQFLAWWTALPEPVRSPAWPRALAALTVLFLLLAFHQVVSDAVRQGELLRMAAASHSEAVWRCGSLRGLRSREGCLAQLQTPPPGEAAPVARNIATLTGSRADEGRPAR